MKLNLFENKEFSRGSHPVIEAVWVLVSAFLVSSFIPGSRYRVTLLKIFGAKIGNRVVLKPCLKVKFPWKLEVGDDVWIGEKVWIDNLANVCIGSNSCISQGAYLCTGSHDWTSQRFDLITKEIHIQDQCWVGAMSKLSPGTTLYKGAVLTIGSTASGELEGWSIYQGNPALKIKDRI
jgi:putative colanic acid biosynthesis acetyltransferase WcaF